MVVAFDVETSRFPDGSPYRNTSVLCSYAACTRIQSGYSSSFYYHSDPDFNSSLQDVIENATTLVTINGKFDLGWALRSGSNIKHGLRIWDCQLAEFILSGQTRVFASMDELCKLYSIAVKEDVVKSFWDAGIETVDIPRAILEEYNVGDTRRTLQIYECQLIDPRMTPALKKLILLAGADLLVLLQMEWNGILYDTNGSLKAGNEALEEITAIKQELQTLVDFEDFNFDSGDHLSCWLYGGDVCVDRFSPVQLIYKSGPRKGEEYTQNKFQETVVKSFPGLFKPLKGTELKKPGFYQTGEPILRQLPLRTKIQRKVIEACLRNGELNKQVGGFLHALPELVEKQGWDNSIIHPTYNQCVARTGRLSCSKPNAQQFPEVVDEYWISRYD